MVFLNQLFEMVVKMVIKGRSANGRPHFYKNQGYDESV